MPTPPMIRTLLLLPLLMACGTALAADPTFPPGSRIGLVPPPEMTPAKGVAGFRNPRTGAAIVALEMPVEAYPSLAVGFTDDALKAQGFVLKTREPPRIAGGNGVMVTGELTEGSRKTFKTVLLAADPTVTVLVIGQLQPGASNEELARVEEAIRTVAIRAPLPLADQIEALPFKVGDMASFRPLRALAGNSLLLTDGPLDAIKEAEQPMVIVAQAIGTPPGQDQRDAVARSILVSNTFVKDVVLERAGGFRQGGADWHEIVARAKDGHSGNPVIVAQTIRWQPDGYLRTVGVVRADQRDLMLPRFRKVADSLAPK